MPSVSFSLRMSDCLVWVFDYFSERRDYFEKRYMCTAYENVIMPLASCD